MAKYRIPLGVGGLSNAQARQELIAHLRLPRGLRRMIDRALRSTNSTGCSVWELERLHRSILAERPRSAIEFGSGISTLVIAYAVRSLADQGHRTRFVTMEQGPEYQANMLAWFPEDLMEFVEFRLSDVVAEPTDDGRTGYRYADTPAEAFDWCFVDGPQLPRKDPSLFDADVLHLPRERRMVVHVDGRASTLQRLVEELVPDDIDRSDLHDWATLVLDQQDPR